MTSISLLPSEMYSNPTITSRNIENKDKNISKTVLKDTSTTIMNITLKEFKNNETYKIFKASDIAIEWEGKEANYFQRESIVKNYVTNYYSDEILHDFLHQHLQKEDIMNLEIDGSIRKFESFALRLGFILSFIFLILSLPIFIGFPSLVGVIMSLGIFIFIKLRQWERGS
ncbi:hypothetical protein ACO1PF_00415 [Alkalibacterium sp. f15]|uniref:hypothetical protein n=1 Tax=Alkalibacterium sp. f15 TaxID=3414029 RepID=UPI003BF78414